MPREKRKDQPKFKDMVDRATVRQLAEILAPHLKSFEAGKFVQRATAPPFDDLELKERIAHIGDVLHRFLPSSYPGVARLLTKAAPKARGFHNWVLTYYVEKYGVEHLDESVAAMKELTKYGSAEFAIRPYLMRYTEQMLAILNEWVSDPNEHVRRLAAEGTRPRGVWMPHVEAFKKDPRPVIKLLTRLKDDPSLYVRKAVANNLNDISKDNPELFIKTARQWLKSPNEHTHWIIKRAARTLIKKGDPEALALFGFGGKPEIRDVKLTAKPMRVKIGDATTLGLKLKSSSKSSQKLAIDYRLHYIKASGKTSAKTFKWAERELGAGDMLELTRKQDFVHRSTRTIYPGKHLIEVTINGEVMATVSVIVV